ncbi:Gfo/Idh/MocA family protein [Alkalicoccus urumqiensis]|uniref:Oxidoreductase n=1 Tax=Alkalicoccus urumqiensis TaxID=1548213 RepID=A0A2P6MGQ8_ALKUR|nr:Gfo/Idh/MocA family oxidoreductase [Alkalicoccus urumqiensis]PRO65464.1 oxidoreductase [Alkalicoccus urumqiensis]
MIHIAAVGTGSIVEKMIDAMHQVEGVHPCAVYSRSMEKARSFQLDQAYDSLEDMLRDELVDAVYIASPNSLHYEHTLACLEAGKHVLCEKPFASNLNEAEVMQQKAEDTGLILMEAITTTYLPNYQQLHSLIEEIAPVRVVQCNYSQYSSRYGKLLNGEEPNVFQPAFSGGALMDINVYNLHFLAGLFGRPDDVQYRAAMYENGIDTSGTALFSYKGFSASAVGSKDTAAESFVQIQGENGSIRIPGGANGCRVVEQWTNEEKKIHTVDQAENTMVYELDFFRRLVNGEETDTGIRQTKLVMEMMTKARESAGIRFPADRKNRQPGE